MNDTPDPFRILSIFQPFRHERRGRIQSNGTPLVHYTSADAAKAIIETKSVWMRKTTCMNDYLEIEHGLTCLAESYRGQAGENFKTAINSIFGGITNDIENVFNHWQDSIWGNTYITCLSEHNRSEDSYGRLSMWRAYSKKTGVALVLNNAPFYNDSIGEVLKVYSNPVAYRDDESFDNQLSKIGENINKNADFVKQLGRDQVANYVFYSFVTEAVCTKHPGFQEEKEWRVMYMPDLQSSEYLVKKIQLVNGIPQPIYRFPLENLPEVGVSGIDINEILDRIIIGPTDYRLAIQEAFSSLLADAGVEDPASRIGFSNIPLRA